MDCCAKVSLRFIQQSPNPQLTPARDFEINHELSLWSFTFVTESFQCTYLTVITRRYESCDMQPITELSVFSISHNLINSSLASHTKFDTMITRKEREKALLIEIP